MMTILGRIGVGKRGRALLGSLVLKELPLFVFRKPARQRSQSWRATELS
jgi:hypothetical protein